MFVADLDVESTCNADIQLKWEVDFHDVLFHSSFGDIVDTMDTERHCLNDVA